MDFTNLKNCLDDILNNTATPSVDCIVYKDHKILFRYFAGLSDVENNREINGSELYLLFSMTKMLTCTAALQLYEQGKFSLEDKLSKYIPEFDKMKITTDALNTENAAKITTGGSFGEEASVKAQGGYAKNPIKIIDLFTMQAGFDYVLGDPCFEQAREKGLTSTLDMVRSMSQKTLGFEPETRFRYSLCHDVIGALIEIWSGKKFGDYLRENIFVPLGMNNTFFGVAKDEALLSKYAARYTADSEGNVKRLPLACEYNLSEEYQSGGAGLSSCTQDYAIFLDALACGGIGKNGNRILKEETVELMKTNQLTGQSLEDFHQIRAGYGYGFGVRTHMDKSASGSLSPVGEFGWDGAAGAFSMVDTKNRLSLTYFQHNHNWSVEIQSKMRNALYSCFDEV